MAANRKKVTAKKSAPKKPKPADKAASKPSSKGAKGAKPVTKAAKKAVKKAAPKKAPAKAAAKARAPRPERGAKASPAPSLKGLKGVSGAKAARIAQIVAESFLPKPAPEPAALSAVDATDEALATAHKAAAVLFSRKAEDVVLMDLRNLSTVADYYLIATCQNEPQMRAILGAVQRTLSREGIKSLRSEYMPGVRWAVVDYGDLILHLFEKQTRGYYSLERLWGDAPSTPLRASDYETADSAEGIADDDGDL